MENTHLFILRTWKCAGALGTNGAQWHSWTAERTAYLGLVLQKMLRGYTEAAVSFTSSLVTFVSRFAVQARPFPDYIFPMVLQSAVCSDQRPVQCLSRV